MPSYSTIWKLAVLLLLRWGTASNWTMNFRLGAVPRVEYQERAQQRPESDTSPTN